jgi:hypothetical protein
MKKHLLTYTSLALLLVFVVSSCGKYEDGPGFTVLTKRMRLQRSWDLAERVNENGVATADNSSDYWMLEKDGKLTAYQGSNNFSGNWSLENDDEYLKISLTFPIIGQLSTTYKIKRLTSKELWLYNETSKITEKYKAK